ncbi:hypothetical protein RCO48_36895 [Peribacillus frigoritolerans]|nr:hypothetical protein [Peribacillus frigoritolerans]
MIWISFQRHYYPAALFSIAVSLVFNILISVLGFIPSVFITAANISVFGFEKGLILSYIGEIAGAVVSFWLYRKGFQTFKPKFMKNRWVKEAAKVTRVSCILDDPDA